MLFLVILTLRWGVDMSAYKIHIMKYFTLNSVLILCTGFVYYWCHSDRFCGLVVIVPDCRHRGPRFDSLLYHFSE
jgi:hypothetical protein